MNECCLCLVPLQLTHESDKAFKVSSKLGFRQSRPLTFKDQDNNTVYKNSLIDDLYIHEECLKGLDYMTAGVRTI